MARNRKRAKERRARRPQPVASARQDRDQAPDPIGHAAPDVDLAEAQVALGRPELVAEPAPGPDYEDGADSELEAEAAEADPGGGGSGARARGGITGDGGDGDGDGAPVPVPAGAQHAIERPKPGNRLINFLQGSWRELQRVQWPDRRQVVQATGVVIGFVIVAGVYLGVADQLATKLMNFILK